MKKRLRQTLIPYALLTLLSRKGFADEEATETVVESAIDAGSAVP